MRIGLWPSPKRTKCISKKPVDSHCLSNLSGPKIFPSLFQPSEHYRYFTQPFNCSNKRDRPKDPCLEKQNRQHNFAGQGRPQGRMRQNTISSVYIQHWKLVTTGIKVTKLQVTFFVQVRFAHFFLECKTLETGNNWYEVTIVTY